MLSKQVMIHASYQSGFILIAKTLGFSSFSALRQSSLDPIPLTPLLMHVHTSQRKHSSERITAACTHAKTLSLRQRQKGYKIHNRISNPRIQCNRGKVLIKADGHRDGIIDTKYPVACC